MWRLETVAGYSVDVGIKFKSSLQTRIDKYEKKIDKHNIRYEKTTTKENPTFNAGSVYYLSNSSHYEKIKQLIVDGSNWKDIETGTSYDNSNVAISTYTDGCDKYTITYYPAAEFKRRTFKCSSTSFSNKTGRLSKMIFQEV